MIPLREQEYIHGRFAQELAGRVKLDLFTQRPSPLYLPGREECATCEDARRLYEELAALSERITLTTHELSEAPDEAAKFGIDKVPGLALRGPANRPLRFYGLPAGNEFPNFVETIIAASQQRTELDPETAKQLKKIKDDVSITVYVTPTCPHCPGVVRAAYRLALASAHVDATAVEIGEFPRLGQQLGIRAVPFTVINDKAGIAGALDERALVDAARKVVEGTFERAPAAGGATSDAGAPPAGAAASSRLIVPR